MTEFAIPDALVPLARSDVYSAHLAAMPKFVSAADDAAVKHDILELLQTTELINFSTLCPSGWPATHCMHFCTVSDGGERPIIYMSTDHETRKLANIRARPQVSLSLYRALGFEQRRQTKAAQLQAVCSDVDGDEKAFALEEMARKPGYGFTKLLELEKQAMLRADVVFALWLDNERRPQRCSVDYRQELVEPGKSPSVGTSQPSEKA